MAYPVTESADCPSLVYSSTGAASVTLEQDGRVAAWNFARSSTLQDCIPLASTSLNTIRKAGDVGASHPTIHPSEKAAIRQNVRWFQKEFADVDVPSSLLRSEIQASFDTNNLQYEDNYLMGNRLCVSGSKLRRWASNQTAFYVMDRSPRILQICEMQRDGANHIKTQRDFPSKITTPMPILGLYESKVDFTTSLPPLLALRSQFSTSIVLPFFDTDDPNDNSTAPIDTITEIGDEFGGHEHHDVAFNGWKRGKEAAIINERGEIVIWTCVANEMGGRRIFFADSLDEWNMQLLNRMDTNEGSIQPKWQVRYTTNDTLLIKSASDLMVLDLRSSGLAQKFHYAQDSSLSASESHLWSVTSATDHDIFVATSDSIAWIDHRFSSRPVLSWNHYRRLDASIAIEVLDRKIDSFETVIWSLSNSLITVYSFDRSGNPPKYSSGLDPYAINTIEGQLSGLSFKTSLNAYDLFTCTSDGQLSHQSLMRSSEQTWPLRSDQLVEESSAADDQFNTTKEFRKVNFSKIFEESLKQGSLDGDTVDYQAPSLGLDVSQCLPSVLGFPFDQGTTPERISSRLKGIYLGISTTEVDEVAKRLAFRHPEPGKEIVKHKNETESGMRTALDHFNTQISLKEEAVSIRDLWNTDMSPADDVIDFAKLLGDEVETEKPKKKSRNFEAMPASDPAPSYVPEIGTSRDHEPVDLFAASQPVAGSHATRSKTKLKKSSRTAGF